MFSFIVIGDIASGKSQLINNMLYPESYYLSRPTLGVEFSSFNMTHKKRPIKIRLWDTGGANSFYNLSKPYIKTVYGIIITVDLSKSKSLISLHKWINLVRVEEKRISPILVIGTKKNNMCCFNYENKVKQTCNDYNIDYFEYNLYNSDPKEPLRILIDKYYDEINQKVLGIYNKKELSTITKPYIKKGIILGPNIINKKIVKKKSLWNLFQKKKYFNYSK